MQKTKILVIDDDELNLKLFHDLLLRKGYEVKALSKTENFVGQMGLFSPDLVIMDIQLDDVSGIDIMYDIKQNPALQAIPVIAVTAFAEKEDEAIMADAGFTNLVPKPISMDSFYDIIDKALVRKQDDS